MSQKYSVEFPEHKHIIELRVENFSSCPVLEGDRIVCPASTADSLFGTVWVFGIYPRGRPGSDPNYLSCFIKREKDEVGPRKPHIEFEISVVTVEGVKIFTKSGSEEFIRGVSYVFPLFVKLLEIFSRKEFLLQLDTLILRCELRLLPPKVKQPPLHIFKSTFPDIEETSRSVVLNNFQEISKQNPMILKFKELENLLLLKVSMNRDKTSENQIQEKAFRDESSDEEPTPTQFHFKLLQEALKIQEEAFGDETSEDEIQEEAVGYETFEYQILGEAVGEGTSEDEIQEEAVGDEISEFQIQEEAVREETSEDKIQEEAVGEDNTGIPESYLHIVMIIKKWNHPVHVSCRIKLFNKNFETVIDRELAHRFTEKGKEEWILPHFIDTNTLGDDCIDDGTLYLDFDFSIYRCKPDSLLEGAFTPLKFAEDPRERALTKDLVDLYQTKKFSDVTLKVGDEKFQAHKSILSARSPKFDEIFAHLMRGGDNSEHSIIEIEGIDKDTMELALKFIYTNQLEDLDAERSSLLYTAAQKYQISSLQCKCLRYFAENLSIKTVCPVLRIAEKYKDPELKMMALDFIVEHNQQILSTPEWENFTEGHKKLSNQVMRLIRLTKEMQLEDWNF